MSSDLSHSDPGSATVVLEKRFAPWYARVGLEGQILLALMLLMTMALSATCWMWAWHSGRKINQVMGMQAEQIASALSLSAESDLAAGNNQRLSLIGDQLCNTSKVLFVAFYDPAGKRIAMGSRKGANVSQFPIASADVEWLTRVREGHSDSGDFLSICTPVMAGAGSSHLAGYVTVGMSSATAQMELLRACIFAAGIGCVVVLISLPLAYWIVHRIFMPIRKLEDATHRITSGELDAQVDIHRTDAIGVLGRAFNEMVATIKQQQEELRQANAELEQKVEQRTGQLQSANKRLSAEIAEKEDFLRAVSHDLNAPLRNISGMASMLLMKHGQSLDQDIIHRLERIQKNVETETGLISELLELSRIKTRRQKTEMVEIVPLVRELEEVFENDLKTKQIALKIETPLPVLNGEKARFRQVFQNLIDNAIKYMGDGTVREIRIGCALGATEAEFYVADSGMGIDPEDIGKVFYVFRRGKNAAHGGIAGKGIGLASVKSIIETYNGTIWVQSQRGQGSTFKFTINGQFVPDLQRAAPTPQPKGTARPMTNEELDNADTALAELLEV